MKKIVLIDGNSILNRAFYGIMGNKMLMTTDGKYTNAVYGFLAILFKVLEDIEPEYLMVTFDLKHQQLDINYMMGIKQIEKVCQMNLQSKCQY